jgi:hypothetical protein
MYEADPSMMYEADPSIVYEAEAALAAPEAEAALSCSRFEQKAGSTDRNQRRLMSMIYIDCSREY